MEHGIPDFRLPKEVLDNTINKILNLGIKVEYNKELGLNLYLDDLEKEYDAIFLSFGKNISTKMGIEGENLNGVLGGNELLEYKNFPDFKDKKVAVIGGGNVAIDVSRTIKQLDAKDVTIIYRRSEAEMPAEEKEIQEAKNENINFLFQTNIVKILGKDRVEAVECIKTKLIEKEEEKRKIPVNIKDSNYLLDIDYVIMAVGSKTDEKLLDTLNVELNKNNTIKVDENFMTSKEKIFAGGDISGEKSTVAWASKSGRDAAYKIKDYLLK